MNKIQEILEVTNKIQNRINELHLKQPNHETFEQEGLLNGSQIVQEYLDYNEYGIAIEHLLYMFYESEIDKPIEISEQINKLTLKYKIKNSYS